MIPSRRSADYADVRLIVEPPAEAVGRRESQGDLRGVGGRLATSLLPFLDNLEHFFVTRFRRFHRLPVNAISCLGEGMQNENRVLVFCTVNRSIAGLPCSISSIALGPTPSFIFVRSEKGRSPF